MERDRWIRTIQDLLSHEEMTRASVAAGTDQDNEMEGGRAGRARTISVSSQNQTSSSTAQPKQTIVKGTQEEKANESPPLHDDEKHDQISESDPPSSIGSQNQLLDSGGEIEPDLPPAPESELEQEEKEMISDEEGNDDD